MDADPELSEAVLGILLFFDPNTDNLASQPTRNIEPGTRRWKKNENLTVIKIRTSKWRRFREEYCAK